MKHILISGIAGMIGSHLLDKLLQENYRITGIDNFKIGKKENIAHNLKHKNFKFIKGDILDLGLINAIGNDIDIIVHLAALKKPTDAESGIDVLMTNTIGTRNLLELAKRIKAKVIFASSSDVYGASEDLPFKEDSVLIVGPTNVKRWSYAISKIFGEQLAFSYYNEHGVPIVILRYFGGFGPRSAVASSGGHIPLFINAILNNKELIIHGDGTQTRSMAYVSDLVDGTLLAMEKECAAEEVFNIGNDEEISMLDTVYLIKEIVGVKTELKIKFIPFEKVFRGYKEIRRRVPDLSKAKKILGYSPKVSFREGLRLTIASYKKRR